MAQYNTFIVRIWTGNDHGLHGQVTHVASQERHDFHELSVMVEFIVDRLGNPGGADELFQPNKHDEGNK